MSCAPRPYPVPAPGPSGISWGGPGGRAYLAELGGFSAQVGYPFRSRCHRWSRQVRALRPQRGCAREPATGPPLQAAQSPSCHFISQASVPGRLRGAIVLALPPPVCPPPPPTHRDRRCRSRAHHAVFPIGLVARTGMLAQPRHPHGRLCYRRYGARRAANHSTSRTHGRRGVGLARPLAAWHSAGGMSRRRVVRDITQRVARSRRRRRRRRSPMAPGSADPASWMRPWAPVGRTECGEGGAGYLGQGPAWQRPREKARRYGYGCGVEIAPRWRVGRAGCPHLRVGSCLWRPAHTGGAPALRMRNLSVGVVRCAPAVLIRLVSRRAENVNHSHVYSLLRAEPRHR